MRILLAEDEKDLNKIMTQKLNADGYSVDSCFDGEEAMDILSYTDYDVIILDIMMPKADGFAVLRDLRERQKNSIGFIRTKCFVLLPNPMPHTKSWQSLRRLAS